MSDIQEISYFIGTDDHDAIDPTEHRKSLAERFARIRAITKELAARLSVEDCMLQSMPDTSPVKWHLAHTTWFFEIFVLERSDPHHIPFDPQYRYLFNSYYDAVGPQYPRARRGLLSRPSLTEIGAYRRTVDEQVLCGLLSGRWPRALLDLIELGLHHEQQHQELILTDIKHGFWGNPDFPAYRMLSVPEIKTAPDHQWIEYEGGRAMVGAASAGFSFDNERPRHAVLLPSFELGSRLVTNGEYAEFIADHGYDRPDLWLSEGWAWRSREHWKAPLYWLHEEKSGRGSPERVFTLGGMRAFDANEPVCHISYFEADAYARWRKCRLPTEHEWECAAVKSGSSRAGTFLDSGLLHPGKTMQNSGIAQLFGDAWEWTQSAYLPYPGFCTAESELGEYNGKFMINQMVLRGGSCATPRDHIRSTYRNFFPPHARWQFSGIRLAR